MTVKPPGIERCGHRGMQVRRNCVAPPVSRNMTAAVGGLGGCPGAAVTEADSCGGALLQRARAASITAMGDQLSVPAGFAVPGGFTAGDMRLEPLGPRHNAADYAAWTASTGYIRATPGLPWGDWPHEMSLAENRRDLERHARDLRGAPRIHLHRAQRRHGRGYRLRLHLPAARPGPGPPQRGRPFPGPRGPGGARPGALPRGPRLAGTRLAVRYDPVRAAALPRGRCAGLAGHLPGREFPGEAAAQRLSQGHLGFTK